MRRRQPLKSNKLKKWLAAPYAVWAVGFIIIPLILILYYAFTGEEGGFTLSNFAYVATKENIKALGLALWLSLLSTVLCLVLAYPLAMILANRNVNQTSFIVLIFILPMWMNFLLRTLAWQTLLEKNGVINSILSFFHLPGISIINTPGAIILGMVYNFLPFMVLPIYNVLIKIDRDVINAARDLGANSVQTFPESNAAAHHAGYRKRYYHGIYPGAYNLCYFRPARRKQDPSDRKRHRAGVQTDQQLECRKRTFHSPDDFHHPVDGSDEQIR